MKTLLILGTGTDQVKGILKAKEAGLYTVGLDIDEKSDGVSLIDEFHKINIKDENEVVRFIKKYSKPIDGVIAFGVDIPEILAKTAEIKNVFYYTDYQTALLSKNKLMAKERMKKQKVSLPLHKRVKEFADLIDGIEEFGYPCVLKPVDNSGARGVLRLTGGIDLKWAFEYSISFSNSDFLILEKFLDGLQISSESFIVDGEVYTVGLSARNYEFLEKFSPFIIENGGDLPPNLDDAQRKEIDEQILKCAEAFNIKNGIIKGDLVLHKGRIFVIEVALRLSGGHFSSLEIPLNTGVDFLQKAIKIALGKKINADGLRYKKRYAVSLRYIFPYRKGKINRLRFPKWMNNHKNIASAGFYYKKGDFANYPVASHPERLGYFIVYDISREKVEHLVNKIYNETVVEIE